MSSSNDVSYVHNGSFKYGMNSSSNMNILISMRINSQCKQPSRHILENTNVFFFRLKALILVQVKHNAQKLYSSKYFELISWFLQYLIVIRHKLIIGLFIRIKIVAFNKFRSQNNKMSFDCPSVFIGYIVSLM